MGNTIPLKKYNEQNWFQTITHAASGTRAETDGLYRVAKIAINVLMYPVLLLAQNNPVSNLKNMFGAFKDLCDFTLIIKPINDWIQIAFDKDFRNKKLTCLETAQRTALTAGGILKTATIGQKLGLWNLGRVSSFAVGNVPIFAAVADTLFGLYFLFGAVRNGMEWHRNSKVITKSDRLIGEWNGAKTKADWASKWSDKVNDLNSALLNAKQGTARDRMIEKRDNILAKELKLTSMTDDEFAKLKERKVEKYTINLTNSKLDRRAAIFGLFSNIGKIAAIAINIIAMQIFGWVGLAAKLTITSVGLAAELLGYSNFLSNVQRVEKQAVAAA